MRADSQVLVHVAPTAHDCLDVYGWQPSPQVQQKSRANLCTPQMRADSQVFLQVL
jgi:hypothetical protein